MTSMQSHAFRSKALLSEKRADEATDPRSRQDWKDLAIEWHLLANLAATADGDVALFDVVQR